jgi:DNA-binding CsgD family transcriptional regulator
MTMTAPASPLPSPARLTRFVAEIDRLGTAGLDGLVLLRRLTDVLRPLVPFDAFCATTTDPGSNLITDAIAERESASITGAPDVTANYFARVYFEHDLGDTLAMLRTGQHVRRLSDATGGDLARSGRYRLHLRPRHLGPEIYATFVDRGLWGELHLTREHGSPDFSDQDLDLLRQVVPHVAAGLKFAALRARADLVTEHDAAEAPGVLILDRAGRVVSSTANVSGFLRDLGARDGAAGNERDLPVAVQVVLAALERAIDRAGAPDGRVPRLRVRAASGRWLILDASQTEPAGARPGERVVVIGPAHSEEIAWLSMSAYELSQREEEVVRLVVRGLSTKQIADQLFITEHTVQRHLSNIFEKVGVRSRRDLVKRLFVEQVLPSLN